MLNKRKNPNCHHDGHQNAIYRFELQSHLDQPSRQGLLSDYFERLFASCHVVCRDVISFKRIEISPTPQKSPGTRRCPSQADQFVYSLD